MRTPENSTTQYRSTPDFESVPGWLPLAGGAALVFLALSRKRTLFGLGTLLGGGYLLYRAVENGTLRLPRDLDSLGLPSDMVERFRSQWLAQSTPQTAVHPARAGHREWPRRDDVDSVDEASMESFPGSDPPATW
ncbi:MAG: hypothetical protein WBC44_15225 [Planctomycetaceae bacterium]